MVIIFLCIYFPKHNTFPIKHFGGMPIEGCDVFSPHKRVIEVDRYEFMERIYLFHWWSVNGSPYCNQWLSGYPSNRLKIFQGGCDHVVHFKEIWKQIYYSSFNTILITDQLTSDYLLYIALIASLIFWKMLWEYNTFFHLLLL